MAKDLIYCGNENYEICKKEILETYSNAQIADSSDDIHGGRFYVEVPDVEEDIFYLWLLKNGYLDISFNLALISMDQPERYKALVRQALAELDAAKAIDYQI